MTATASLASLIEQGLAELGAEAPSGAPGALAELALLVEEWGRRINLSGHRDADTIVRRLVLDAAGLLEAAPIEGTCADLGSGAGFPGLPIAILRPSARLVLVEARERRHHFQRHAIRALGLVNVTALRGRIEQVEPIPSEVVLAQAVAPPDRLLPWMLRWAKPGALLIVPGGTSKRAVPPLSEVAQPGNATYRVPLGGPLRTLWTGRAL